MPAVQGYTITSQAFSRDRVDVFLRVLDPTSAFISSRLHSLPKVLGEQTSRALHELSFAAAAEEMLAEGLVDDLHSFLQLGLFFVESRNMLCDFLDAFTQGGESCQRI